MATEQFDSGHYWELRYQEGRDSGDGSYGRLAAYKAEFLNKFVREQTIGSVIELGCGDGAQLELATYPQYVGVDISPAAIDMCRQAYIEDLTKCFITYDLFHYSPKCELALSLDVIFHLVEDGIYERYMRDLFGCSSRFVIIYSSDRNESTPWPHVRHRSFTKWIASKIHGWKLISHDPNPYPQDVAQPGDTSFADFYVYRKY